jgi:hypothetical protein
MTGRSLPIGVAVTLLEGGAFNLIRRGHEGSLVLSMDRWRYVGLIGNALRFEAVDPQGGAPPPLEVPLDDVEEATWDRLPRQQSRSQVRFRLRGGELLTFSGKVDESRLDQA